MQRPPIARASYLAVTGGTASASTRLTVFDLALHDAGLHDSNLIQISSVVPTNATVDTSASPAEIAQAVEPGMFLPTVYSFEASNTPGDHVHAAVAGARFSSGYGINVEDHGVNQDPATVRERCDAMLTEMAETRDETLTDERWFQLETATVQPSDDWAGAVAAMAYFDTDRP